MIKSIQHFQGVGVKSLEEIMVNYSGDMTKIAEMVYGVTETVVKLGLSMISEELENYDNHLRKNKTCRKEWHIVKIDETTLLTSLGSVTYKKTLFKNKNTGKREYLLDRAMGIEKHARMTEDAHAKILEEAVESSYRKGGKNASIGNEEVSKETVMNKVHVLKFPKASPQKEKKALKYLYIDADEDHVALQYLDKKGDIKKPRNNTVMPKIVYVYEGVENDGTRNKLVNKKHFGGVYEGSAGVEALWNEVYEYIAASYETEEIKKIYVSGDGAGWIKSGAKLIGKAKFVLDRFHLHKYIVGATSHLLDSVSDAREEIYSSIYSQKKWCCAQVFDKIMNATKSESKYKTVEAAKGYILGNWSGIMEKVRSKDKQLKCSAEGAVSHVYASRMSSRPLGWSRSGADKMARLRIYYYNKGNMLELVRYQKEELPKVAGGEDMIYSCGEMRIMENKKRKELGVYADMPVYSIPYPQIKKIANFRNNIWGL